MFTTSRYRWLGRWVSALLVGATIGWIAWVIGRADLFAGSNDLALASLSIAATALAATATALVARNLRSQTRLVQAVALPDAVRFVAVEDGHRIEEIIPAAALLALRVGELRVDSSTLYRAEVDVAAPATHGDSHTICLAGGAARSAVAALLEVRPDLPVQHRPVDEVGRSGRFAPDMSTGEAVGLVCGVAVAATSLTVAAAALVAVTS